MSNYDFFMGFKWVITNVRMPCGKYSVSSEHY
jgi:hypothetical protein